MHKYLSKLGKSVREIILLDSGPRLVELQLQNMNDINYEKFICDSIIKLGTQYLSSSDKDKLKLFTHMPLLKEVFGDNCLELDNTNLERNMNEVVKNLFQGDTNNSILQTYCNIIISNMKSNSNIMQKYSGYEKLLNIEIITVFKTNEWEFDISKVDNNIYNEIIVSKDHANMIVSSEIFNYFEYLNLNCN